MASLYEKFFNKKPPFSESKFKKEQDTPHPGSLISNKSRDLLQSKNFTPESITEIERYFDIFSRDPKPVEMYIEQMATEGRSDIKNFSKFMHPDDKMKLGDYNYMGGKVYDMMYRKETKSGQKATKKLLKSNWLKPAVGVSTGVWNTIAGTAELGAALSDLTFDTKTLAVVEKALPAVELMDLYGDKQGSVAKFTSILVQYGLGWGLARTVAQKVIGKLAKSGW